MNFRFAMILLQNMHEFSLFSYNSSLWECMAHCISQHNFMPDLDKDLKVGLFNFVFSGNILSIIPYYYHQKYFH